MDIQYGNGAALHWLWIAVLCWGVMVAGVIFNRRRWRVFATENLVDQLVPRRSVARQTLRILLLTAAMILLSIALVDMRWGKQARQVPQQGIEVMFVLDVSRSMLAQDVTPNRLERAKQQINDMLDAMAGDRVGLVLFAGDVRQEVPMTSHYDDFRRSLKGISPESVSRGGSRLGDAIRIASEGFLTQVNDHKAMVILTDGEDQESEPVQMAQRAYQDHGIRIFTIGLGDMEQGARIPADSRRQGDYLQYEGQQVWSRLDGQILLAIATETDGAFIPAGTKQVDMGDVYRGYVSSVPQTEFEMATIDQYQPRFQWFVALALVCCVAQIGVGRSAVAAEQS
ncbi:VWA domain-containing protein [Novipirellula artificiosorum]|uniref:von Willebrand factor type A domain protein n=1 Tax=Novipirellula artificiosorum TaxID=2528016 RepID=A0A5C6D972_9BACT|nr:VWA domain-containing protein [Novipirellula artificiosorum]TWU31756.1 von Willebrand factor type A domain protein [Novipirellula artificiosorum]